MRLRSRWKVGDKREGGESRLTPRLLAQATVMTGLLAGNRGKMIHFALKRLK